MSKKNASTNPEVVETPDVEVEKVTKTGTVTLPKEYKKLNIRKAPETTGTVLCTVANKAKLEIGEAPSDVNWLKVKTKEGVSGYCMKKYVVIK